MPFLFKGCLSLFYSYKTHCWCFAPLHCGSAPLIQSHFRDAGTYNCFYNCHWGTLMTFYKVFVIWMTLPETKLKRKLTHALTTTTHQAACIQPCFVQELSRGHPKFNHRTDNVLLLSVYYIIAIIIFSVIVVSITDPRKWKLTGQ